MGPWLPELLTGGSRSPPALRRRRRRTRPSSARWCRWPCSSSSRRCRGRAGGVRPPRGLRPVDGGGRGVLGRTEAAVRQMAHRAREHVHARQPRFDADRRAQREVTQRFLAAVGGGDLDALLAALAPDVVLISDGGGRTKAALRPITGADKVARWLVAVAEQGEHPWPADRGGRGQRLARDRGVDGRGAVRVDLLAVADGRIEQVLVVVNPDKLATSSCPPGADLGSAGDSALPQPPPSTSSARCASSPTPTTSTSAARAPSRPGPRPAPRSSTASSPTATRVASTRRRASRWARCGRPSSGPPRRRSASPTSASSAIRTGGSSSPSTCAAATSAGSSGGSTARPHHVTRALLGPHRRQPPRPHDRRRVDPARSIPMHATRSPSRNSWTTRASRWAVSEVG